MGILPEKLQSDQTQNDQLLAIINFNMRDIWQNMPDNSTITVNQNVWFQWEIYHQKYQLDKV